MRAQRFLLVIAVALAATACKKAEPPPAKIAGARPQAQAAAKKSAPRERGEYTDMPTGAQSYTHSVEEAIAGEAMRGGPNGEPRIFESPEEMAELIRGRSPKTMNAQFRYYLVGVRMVPPKGDCKTSLLAVNVAVENLHGTPTAAIYGEFTFTQSVGGDGSALAETVAVPFHADIIGPFSNKQGGFVYATAYLEPIDGMRDNERWTQIASVNPQRLKVWFRPEAFYYPDNTQFGLRTGKMPAQRTVMTCGGNDGGKPLLK